jgi:hypothetical protein
VFNVIHVDQPPVAASVTTTGYNDAIETAVFLNFGDIDNTFSEMTVYFSSLPQHGTLYTQNGYPNSPVEIGQGFTAQETFDYVSSEPFAYGTNFDSFSYYVQDPSGSNSLVTTNYINLENYSQPPVSTTPSNYFIFVNTNLAVTISGTDSDTDLLYVHITQMPANGSLFYEGYNLGNYTLPILLTTNPGTNPVVVYVPNTNYVGQDSFGYSIENLYALQTGGLDVPVPGTVTVTIGRVHLEAIANDLGNTPYGPSGLPQLTTNFIQVNFVSP